MHARKVGSRAQTKLYSKKEFELTQEIMDRLAYQANELVMIEEFKDIQKRSRMLQSLMKQKRFSEEETDWLNIVFLQNLSVLLKK